jgi:hypothetical protein
LVVNQKREENYMSVWQKFPDKLTLSERRNLTSAAAATLMEFRPTGTPVPADLMTISPLAASRHLAELMSKHGLESDVEAIQELLEDEDRAWEACASTLNLLRRIPELRDEVDQAYEERQNAMTGPVEFLLAGALLVLAMKIKRVVLTKDRKEVEFYDAGDSVKATVQRLLTE